MAKREEKGSASSSFRETELWMHWARLFVMVIWTIMLISVLAGLTVTTTHFRNATTADGKYTLERDVLAHMRDVLYMTVGKMELNVNDELRKMEVSEAALLTGDMAEDAWRKSRNGGTFSLLTFVGVVSLISLYWWGYGRERMQGNQLCGARLVEGREPARLIRHRDGASPYEIAGVPMRVRSEALHMLFTSVWNMGKSRQFSVLMKQVRVRDEWMITCNPTGEFTQALYCEGKDILVNPLDSRSPNRNIWNEIAKDYHFDNMTNGLIPDPAKSDPFWALTGRMVLKGVIVILGRKGRYTNRDFYNAIAKNNLDAMHALLQGTTGATYVDPVTERTGMSLEMTVQN